MQTIKLNNGVEMPMIGYGTMFDPKKTEEKVLEALETGYRMIDTAAAYRNEAEVGAAVKKSGIPREKIFITSKLWPQDFGYKKAKQWIEHTLDVMGLDYLDLYLIHLPFRDYYGAWKAMEEFYEAGKIRALGVSNFSPKRMQDFCSKVNVIPAVNQLEVHPFFQQAETLEAMRKWNITLEAWGPFAEGKKGIFQSEILKSIGNKYNKSVAQVILRWQLQRGIVTIPKSLHKERMKENISIFDFQLSEEDMAAIAAMDTGCGVVGNPNNPLLAFTKVHN